MKIKRRKKLDRTAYFYMSPLAYLKYRLLTNPERRINRVTDPSVRLERDRKRAARFRQDFKEGFPVRLDALIAADLQKRGLTFTRETIDPIGPPCDP